MDLPRPDRERAAAEWQEHGCAVVRACLTAEEIAGLRRAAERVLSAFLANDPETGRPGDPDGNSIRHLHHPAYLEARDADLDRMMRLIASSTMLRLAEAALGAAPVFRDSNLWFNPFFTPGRARWHRDVQYALPEDVEQRLLAGPTFWRAVVHIQIPLWPSAHLEYVPGSHRRPDAPDEAAVRLATSDEACSGEMPGAARFAADAGDIVLLSPAGIHRGRYEPEPVRRTVQLVYGRPDALSFYSSDQRWRSAPDYEALLPADARDYLRSCTHLLANVDAPSWHP
jgi:hypothetical protein